MHIKWDRFLIFCLILTLSCSGLLLMGDKKKNKRKDKRREESLRLETSDRYLKKWLKQDVLYIISEEERESFKRMSTDDERYQFIEQFWLRRDPSPDTLSNEYREEHYRRIAFSNERFASGKPGWQTDRGRMYIRFGPPDKIDSHPAGGFYQRGPEEGGGATLAFPYEVWRYRYLEGRALGEQILIEFIDPSFTGEYRMSLRPSEKDMLYYTPQLALTDAEQMGLSFKEFRDPQGIGPGMSGNLQPYKKFEKLRQFAALNRAPRIKFKDLETVVDTKLSYNLLAFQFSTDFFKITDDTVLTPITVQLQNKDLTYQNDNGIQRARVNVFGRITTITGRVAHVFEDVIARDVPEALFKQALERKSLYQKSLPLSSGRYKLELVLKDLNSGNIGTEYFGFVVPRFPEERLATSSIILADSIEKLSSEQLGSGMFVVGGTKIHPNVEDRFHRSTTMGIYFQIYNLSLDKAQNRPSASIELTLMKGDMELTRLTKKEQDMEGAAHQMTLEQHLSLNALDPGKYKLGLKVTDDLSNRTVQQMAKFEVF